MNPTRLIRGHVHLNGVSFVTVVAIMVTTNFLIRGVAGRHANHPAARAAAYVL